MKPNPPDESFAAPFCEPSGARAGRESLVILAARTARRRRVRNQAGGTLAVVLAALLIWLPGPDIEGPGRVVQIPPPKKPPQVQFALETVHSMPLGAEHRLNSVALARSMRVEAVSQVPMVRTDPEVYFVERLDDRGLFRQLAGRPVALVQLDTGGEALVFLNAEDWNGIPVTP